MWLSRVPSNTVAFTKKTTARPRLLSSYPINGVEFGGLRRRDNREAAPPDESGVPVNTCEADDEHGSSKAEAVGLRSRPCLHQVMTSSRVVEASAYIGSPSPR